MMFRALIVFLFEFYIKSAKAALLRCFCRILVLKGLNYVKELAIVQKELREKKKNVIFI